MNKLGSWFIVGPLIMGLVASVLLAFFISLAPFTSFAASSQVSDPTFSDDRISVRTQAQFGAEQFSGSATYEVPISIPPGRNGQTPSLRLIYSSQSAGDDVSPFGYGWDVSIPYIQRLNKVGVDKLYSGDNYFSSLDGELASTSQNVFRAISKVSSLSAMNPISLGIGN